MKETIEKENAEKLIDKIVYENINENDSQLIKSIQNTYKKFFHYSDEAGDLIHLIPGIKASVEALRKKYKLAIYSNSKRVSIERDLKEILDKFEFIVSEEDVVKKKPSGEGILIACKKLGIKPSEAVYVGDSQVDIQAAKDAGCKSVAVLTGMGLKIHLEKEKPDYIFKDLKEMADKFC